MTLKASISNLIDFHAVQRKFNDYFTYPISVILIHQIISIIAYMFLTWTIATIDMGAYTIYIMGAYVYLALGIFVVFLLHEGAGEVQQKVKDNKKYNAK